MCIEYPIRDFASCVLVHVHGVLGVAREKVDARIRKALRLPVRVGALTTVPLPHSPLTPIA